ncbi:hypothetical protein [Bacillus sp. CHD6a]|uniref:hypothetical protein n=1 Tax=Bacillus sp. CHD6a TaxID=1643452 RepID=UPI000A95B3E9|nr:hypothetical protein [Bacillus sp. CHD6a]
MITIEKGPNWKQAEENFYRLALKIIGEKIAEEKIRCKEKEDTQEEIRTEYKR